MRERLRKLWSNRTARVLILSSIALLLLLVSWLVFGGGTSQTSAVGIQTEREQRLAALLSEVEDAGNVTVMIAEEGGTPVSVVILFDGEDGILVRLRLTQIAAQALNLAENRVLVYPAEDRK